MTNAPKTVGILLLLSGVGWGLAVSAFVLAGRAAGKIDAPAAVLGVGIFAALPALAAVAAGALLVRAGLRQDRRLRQIALDRQVLERLAARGQLYLPELSAELGVGLDELRECVYRIAGENLLAGYINWAEQRLYSADAAALTQRSVCPNCGGRLELAGRGVIRCPYCGTEIFLPRPAQRRPEAEPAAAEPAPAELTRRGAAGEGGREAPSRGGQAGNPPEPPRPEPRTGAPPDRPSGPSRGPAG